METNAKQTRMRRGGNPPGERPRKTIYQKILRAAEEGRDLRITEDDVALLAEDDAIRERGDRDNENDTARREINARLLEQRAYGGN